MNVFHTPVSVRMLTEACLDIQSGSHRQRHRVLTDRSMRNFLQDDDDTLPSAASMSEEYIGEQKHFTPLQTSLQNSNRILCVFSDEVLWVDSSDAAVVKK